MCDPVTALAVGSLVVQGASAIEKNRAQKKQAQATRANAATAEELNTQAITAREGQTEQAASQSILTTDRQARGAEASVAASAGEANVAGHSVDALMGSIGAQAGEANTTTDINEQDTLAQDQLEKRGVKAQQLNEDSNAPFPSDFATGLQIGGAVLNTGSSLYNYRNPPKSAGG